ncbi:MAG TPA: rhodanese-related sulfurtransferase [Balneolales bacterium]|nr:rhodanese-related sulfurtransferase [Balneolales bacterium]
MYSTILYYKFTHIEEPQAFREKHISLCRELGILGRIYISHEGLNGTVAAAETQIELYKTKLRQEPGFEDISFKQEKTKSIPFEKLKVKIRQEIVALKSDIPIDPSKDGQGYLEPHEWRKMIESDEDFVMIDVRNNYESQVGHFEGALTPDLDNFYDFPKWIDDFGIDKNKKILMYCTGGIRCEKFSILMRNKGYADVYQLHGGILNYKHEQNGAHFKGKCFVFDDRLTVPVNPEDSDPLTKCEITGTPCDTYINCANMECNRLFICSEEGARLMDGCCSEECKKSPYKRPFNPDDIYAPFRKWYHYFGTEFKERHVDS